MPGKKATAKSIHRNDPLVPIVGGRVDAALRWREISYSRAAKRANVTRQAVALIATGTTTKCRRSLRASLAAQCGYPVSARYLGGAEVLTVPALSAFPTGGGLDAKLPLDGAGFPAPSSGQAVERAPLYDLVAFELANGIAASPDLARALGPEYPLPDVKNAIRYMLGLPLWREFLFEDRAWAADTDAYRKDATDFAVHMAAALTALLRPWMDGRTKMRPRVLRRWTGALDDVAGENMMLSFARARGTLSEFAILEVSHGDVELKRHLRSWRDAERAKGRSEAEIADHIRRGESDDDDEDSVPI